MNESFIINFHFFWQSSIMTSWANNDQNGWIQNPNHYSLINKQPIENGRK